MYYFNDYYPTLITKDKIQLFGGNMIEKQKMYYNQRKIIDQIHDDTDCSIYEISKILTSLGNVVKDNLGNGDNVEIKLFSGLKITSQFIPPEQSKSNLYKDGHIASGDALRLSAVFSKDFKNKVRALHKHYKN